MLDEIASQSGRICPVKKISEWCKEKDIVLVVDGTQCFNFDNVLNADYFVFSTHKWLANVKTCAIMFYKDTAKAPLPNTPPGISFGYKSDNIQSSFLWTGMDNHIPYVTLGKAIQIFEKFGDEQIEYSSNMLKDGLQ